MGTFGNEFWNVLALEPTQMASPPPIPNGDARMALSEILSAAGRSTLPGVVIYLPPRDYIIQPLGRSPRRLLQDAWNSPDLLIPPKVTLWLAPGARLMIVEEAVIRIDGPLRAEPTQIFACQGTDSPTSRRGRVLLYSTKVAEVYPEWWGAVSSPDEEIYMREPRMLDDTDALMDCIRTAHSHRAFPNGGAMPTIPIVLRGRYFVTRELEVTGRGPALGSGRPDRYLTFEDRGPRGEIINVNLTGLVLQGRRGVGGSDAGFSALVAYGPIPAGVAPAEIEDKPKGRALLRIEGLHGSLIENIAFDGNNLASACMQITGNNARSTTFRGCSFSKAKHVLAQVGDYIIVDRMLRISSQTRLNFYPLSSRPESYSDGGYDLSGLRFENCRFESGISIPYPIPPGAADSAAVTSAVAAREAVSVEARKVTGIVFHAGNTLPMTLDHCFYVGGMAACVAAYCYRAS